MTESNLLAAFLMGLAGSGHCVAMCGGIAGSFQFASRNLTPSFAALFYNLGRLLSYVAAGALVGGISHIFAKQNTQMGLGLSLISGVFMVLVGLYVMRVWSGLTLLEQAGKWAVWQHLVKLNQLLLPINTYPKALLYGALWGWLPCGLVYSALTWTITSQSALWGGLFMLFFALGTFPALLAVGLGANKVKQLLNQTWARLLLGNLLIWYGLYTIAVAYLSLVK